MPDRCETFRDCRIIIPLVSLKCLSVWSILCSFYGSPNEQNGMCELCTLNYNYVTYYGIM